MNIPCLICEQYLEIKIENYYLKIIALMAHRIIVLKKYKKKHTKIIESLRNGRTGAS